TEAFFLRPVPLRGRHPELYRLLADVYRQDPAGWRELTAAEAARAGAADAEYTRHAIAERTAAVRLRPDWADGYRFRAECHWELGEYEQAVADYGEVIRLTEGDERAQAYWDRGYTYRDAERYAEALADFDQALKLLPTFAAAYRERGATYAEAGEPERALADLKRAIRLDPDDDASYVARAQVYVDTGAPAKALVDCGKAIRRNPEW